MVVSQEIVATAPEINLCRVQVHVHITIGEGSGDVHGFNHTEVILDDQLEFLQPLAGGVVAILACLDLDHRALGPLRAVLAADDREHIVLDGLVGFLFGFRLGLLLLLLRTRDARGGRQTTISLQVCRHEVRNRPYQTIGEFRENLIVLNIGPRRKHRPCLGFHASTLHLVVPPDVARLSLFLS